MANQSRKSTGVAGLDERLGGGLIPGTLTVVVGATGIGKTQLGLQFLNASCPDERRGVIFDMTARGDSQSHREYARGMFDWELGQIDSEKNPDLENFFDASRQRGNYLHVFDYRGQRVTRRDLEFEQWQEWQGELNAKLRSTIAFLYSNFLHGCQRVVIDGVEPAGRAGESIQMNLFEYVYHQILRKEPEWVARDLFRERYRQNAEEVSRHVYDPSQIACVLLCTSHETMLDDMIARGIEEGDALSNANSLIYMGKIRDGNQIKRGLYIAKHRGSACSDEISYYEIDDKGIRLAD